LDDTVSSVGATSSVCGGGFLNGSITVVVVTGVVDKVVVTKVFVS
jgi:hypothetical protein